MGEMARRPTLKDVARIAGVSQMTASRALRGGRDVSPATVESVLRAARELGYVPNRIAGSLASSRVGLVGVIFPSLSSFVFPEVLSGISAGLEGSALQPVVGLTAYDPETEERVIREMLSWRPAGLVIAGLEHGDAARRLLEGADVPVVEIMDVDGAPIAHCVGISHLDAGRRMAGEILSRGYRRIGFIGTKLPQDYRAAKRLRGFVETLAAAGLAPVARELYSGGSTLAKGRELTARLLARVPDVECIYYSSDVMSAGGLMHCLAQGLDVPGDLALAGFNGLDLLDGLPVRLATTDAHRFEIGRRAAELVLEAPASARHVALEATVEPGESL